MVRTGDFTKMLCNFKHQPLAIIADFKGVQNGRQFAVKLNVNNRANNLTILPIALFAVVFLRRASRFFGACFAMSRFILCSAAT